MKKATLKRIITTRRLFVGYFRERRDVIFVVTLFEREARCHYQSNRLRITPSASSPSRPCTAPYMSVVWRPRRAVSMIGRAALRSFTDGLDRDHFHPQSFLYVSLNFPIHLPIPSVQIRVRMERKERKKGDITDTAISSSISYVFHSASPPQCLEGLVAQVWR
ncbi:hypothetical protein E2C01_045735 [Portunus trituberculatus]|uniref:Uncharacterized protein n=1 Tax=Portunus trituberculatus TaxID=210409 RepID=A0A5B7G3Y1_PORTR|nr:hypothetical protein [Portunus trituberculatus]